MQNTALGIFFILSLTWCAWRDEALFLYTSGYGYLEHPGIFGWYAIQLSMPLSIFVLLDRTMRTKRRWANLCSTANADFRSGIVEPTIRFVGFETQESRNIFGIMFSIGLAGFAWNTFQNLHPGDLAPLDFWDSISFRAGYFGTRINKFYMHALLLPSMLHIFAGIVFTQLRYMRSKFISNQLRIAPFDPDRCGGTGFLPDLILSPTIMAMILSGGAYWGVIYTHRTVDISTAMGSLVVIFTFIVFYLWPTLLLRTTMIGLRLKENQIIHAQQSQYYKLMLERQLSGKKLDEALSYLQYFEQARRKVDEVPLWPHLTRVIGTFSAAVTLPIFISIANLGLNITNIFANQH